MCALAGGLVIPSLLFHVWSHSQVSTHTAPGQLATLLCLIVARLCCRCCCLLHLQARIVALNAQYFLKTGGNFVISIKASCIDSTAQPEAVFAREVKKLIESQLKPKEQVRLTQFDVRLVHWFACFASACSDDSRLLIRFCWCLAAQW